MALFASLINRTLIGRKCVTCEVPLKKPITTSWIYQVVQFFVRKYTLCFLGFEPRTPLSEPFLPPHNTTIVFFCEHNTTIVNNMRITPFKSLVQTTFNSGFLEQLPIIHPWVVDLSRPSLKIIY